MAVVTNMNYVRDYQKKVSKKVMNEEIINVVQTKMILETVLSWQKNINSLGLPLPLSSSCTEAIQVHVVILQSPLKKEF